MLNAGWARIRQTQIMDDLPLLGMAMQALPGAFALLLGSGVSSAAGIPTGYGITIDLIRRIASAKGVSPAPDPESWYYAEFNGEASYTEVLRKVAPHSAHERSAILRRYFEPSADEAAAGEKQPTAAHRAIAQLVASGYVRVVLTTNFDRLVEQALEEVGIRPVVISTAAAASGASPLQHNVCTLIKVHGDYLDPNIRNTDAELAAYSAPMNRLLDRVLDEYGLVICGWSAQWDIALRAALERCKSHRFTTYWASQRPPGDSEATLMSLRRAVAIPIADANGFFEDMLATVTRAAEQTLPGQREHAATTPQAVVRQVERMVDDPTKRVALRKLVEDQSQSLATALATQDLPVSTSHAAPTVTSLGERMRAYELASANAVALMAAAADYFADDAQVALLVELLQNSVPREVAGGFTAYIDLRLYPSLLLLYAGGMGALRAGRYKTLVNLWYAKVATASGEPDQEAVRVLRPSRVVAAEAAQSLLPTPRLLTPVSEYLFVTLREPMRATVLADAVYETVFDTYEFLSAMVAADLAREGYAPQPHIGRFGWKARSLEQSYVGTAIRQDIAAAGTEWPLLSAGAFDGDLRRAIAALDLVDGRVRQLPWH